MTIDLNQPYGPRAFISDRDGTIHRGLGPMTEEVTRRFDECIRGFAQAIAASDAACEQMTPREQAEAAWTPTSPYSVDELEDRIRRRRGLPPAMRGGLDG